MKGRGKSHLSSQISIGHLYSPFTRSVWPRLTFDTETRAYFAEEGEKIHAHRHPHCTLSARVHCTVFSEYTGRLATLYPIPRPSKAPHKWGKGRSKNEGESEGKKEKKRQKVDPCDTLYVILMHLLLACQSEKRSRNRRSHVEMGNRCTFQSEKLCDKYPTVRSTIEVTLNSRITQRIRLNCHWVPLSLSLSFEQQHFRSCTGCSLCSWLFALLVLQLLHYWTRGEHLQELARLQSVSLYIWLALCSTSRGSTQVKSGVTVKIGSR